MIQMISEESKAILRICNLELVREYESFVLVRRGQHLGICWSLRPHQMLMIKKFNEHTTGTTVHNERDTLPLMFKTDGEFKVETKKYLADRRALGYGSRAPFEVIMERALEWLAEEGT
jgi:hypothetical protein